MTKYTVYLRIARNGKVSASQKPIYKTLEIGAPYAARPLPTVQIALELDIPNQAFIPSTYAIQVHNEQALLEVKEKKQ